MAPRSIALFWLLVGLVRVLSEEVLVLERSCDCFIPNRSTRGQRKSYQQHLCGTKVGKRGLQFVPQLLAIPHAIRSIRYTSNVRCAGLHASTMAACWSRQSERFAVREQEENQKSRDLETPREGPHLNAIELVASSLQDH